MADSAGPFGFFSKLMRRGAEAAASADPYGITYKLTKPNPLGHTPGDLPSGRVSLFEHADWNSPRFDIDINQYSEKDRHLLEGRGRDNATWVAWNLPIGTVVTLCDHHRSWDKNGTKSVGDLEGLGGAVDLVGTGNPESTDLNSVHLNDLVATMLWRAVDLRYGAFEMFEHPNFTGIRTTVFLAEWAPNVKHSIVGWHMNDSMTSLKWHGLPDRLSIKLFEHPDGGRSFDRALGWSSMKEAGYLPDHDFNDNVSAFEWYPVIPQKEIIEPVTIKVDTSAGSEAISNEVAQSNRSGSDQKMTLSAEKTISETLTVSTSETHTTSVKVTASQEGGGGIPGVAEAKFTLSLELGYENQKTKTRENAVTTEIKVGVANEVTCAPGGTTKARCITRVNKIPPTRVETKATRWYSEAIAGAERDDSNPKAVWKRVEPVFITVSGGIASSTVADVEFFKDQYFDSR
ncbi:hypothetical protein CKM354_000751600 [Cercospora kikuchii]|uniref:Uncharacterized protein n=1 Tax=Cercospora kikuchii TaxID=84275 RepID=A0A9P3CK50_9PEZI|nr:uncharacterized protein CKM354_000751600 [Cercospora kikuchii]GIZ44314.1 hypothetical protein CKM354_000751600 [Cercospora kikuchii]